MPTRAALSSLLKANAGSMLGVLVSLLGFVIAALAIVISLHDRGLMAEMARRNGEGWKQLLQVFSSSSKVIGVFAVFLFVVAAFNIDQAPVPIREALAGLYVALLVWTGLQVAKIIFSLEKAGGLATSPGSRKPGGDQG